ncbi:MAG: RT0821/Lpp0805 family surface protein [Geminicoccaceae bacterium]
MKLIPVLVMVLVSVLGAAPGHAADHVPASADDKVVVPLVNQALEREPTGVEVQWSNPATGNRGIIVVLRTLSTLPDRPCRKYRRTRVRPEANVEVIEGVGCRIGAGNWALEEEETNLTKAAEKEEPPGGGKTAAVARPAAPSTRQRCPLLDPDMVVHVPCRQPAPFVDFTTPAKAVY